MWKALLLQNQTACMSAIRYSLYCHNKLPTSSHKHLKDVQEWPIRCMSKLSLTVPFPTTFLLMLLPYSPPSVFSSCSLRYHHIFHPLLCSSFILLYCSLCRLCRRSTQERVPKSCAQKGSQTATATSIVKPQYSHKVTIPSINYDVLCCLEKIISRKALGVNAETWGTFTEKFFKIKKGYNKLNPIQEHLSVPSKHLIHTDGGTTKKKVAEDL